MNSKLRKYGVPTLLLVAGLISLLVQIYILISVYRFDIYGYWFNGDFTNLFSYPNSRLDFLAKFLHLASILVMLIGGLLLFTNKGAKMSFIPLIALPIYAFHTVISSIYDENVFGSQYLTISKWDIFKLNFVGGGLDLSLKWNVITYLQGATSYILLIGAAALSIVEISSRSQGQQSKVDSVATYTAIQSNSPIQTRKIEVEMTTQNNENQWLVKLPGQPDQPVDTATLQMWARSGVIRPDTLILEVRNGMSYTASQIPSVFSSKSYVTALLLSFFLGYLGIDRFYLGQTGLGIGKLLTFGGCGIWALIDFILIAMRKVTDAQGNPLA